MPEAETKTIISASDLANYVVCPEAWRIKFNSQAASPDPKKSKKELRRHSSRSKEAAESRKEWIETHSNLAQLRLYTKVAYVLLVMLVIVVFLMELNK